ncbi:hypothetical protein ACEN2I_12270 [Flavobacterium sp. W22_SRS_FK3]|uniref:hypothetical protein n=1 Tax=Flavobacterium sp. W22_SRS_FK3 TaxID=3240275 RepID=UPI003F8F3B90
MVDHEDFFHEIDEGQRYLWLDFDYKTLQLLPKPQKYFSDELFSNWLIRSN